MNIDPVRTRTCSALRHRRDLGWITEQHGCEQRLRRTAAVACPGRRGDVAELRGKVQSATELGRVTIDLSRNNIIKSFDPRGNQPGAVKC